MSKAIDKALSEANFLVGFCKSAPHIINADKDVLMRWVSGLNIATKNAEAAINKVILEDTTHD